MLLGVFQHTMNTILTIIIFGTIIGYNADLEAKQEGQEFRLRHCLKCNHGKCITPVNLVIDARAEEKCKCDDGYVTVDEANPCNHKQKNFVAALVLSIFLGEFGIDWFYLSAGSGVYIFAGIMKLITLGGIGIWWFVDICRIAAGSFPDGYGIELE